MRQVGIIAAAGIHALEHHVDRLAEDHHRAQRLAQELHALGFTVEPSETNMVYVSLDEAPRQVNRLEQMGIRCAAVSPDRIRMVTHLDVNDSGITQTIRAFEQLRDCA